MEGGAGGEREGLVEGGAGGEREGLVEGGAGLYRALSLKFTKCSS